MTSENGPSTTPTLDDILATVGERLWALAPDEHRESAHRDITFGVTWQDVMQVVEDGLCAAFGVRWAVRHQITDPRKQTGLYTDGPVYDARHEAEAEAERLQSVHPDHAHYVVEALTATNGKGSK